MVSSPPVPKPGTKQESRIRKIDLLDHAITALKEYVEHHDGRLLLPLRFHESFRVITSAPQESPLVLAVPPGSVHAEDSGKKNKPLPKSKAPA